MHWDWQRRSKVSAGETDCLKLNTSSRVKKPKNSLSALSQQDLRSSSEYYSACSTATSWRQNTSRSWSLQPTLDSLLPGRINGSPAGLASSGLASSEERVQVQRRERTSNKKKKLFTSLFRRGPDLQRMEGRNPHFPASIHLTSFLSFTRSPLNANSLPATHPHSNPHSSPLFYSFLYLYFSNPSSLSQKQLVHPLISHQV